MTFIPQDVVSRALKLATEAVGGLADGHQAHGARHARALHLAYGVLSIAFPGAAHVEIAFALGFSRAELHRAHPRYSNMRATQRRLALLGLPHWHDERLEQRLVDALRRGDRAREDLAYAARARLARVSTEPARLSGRGRGRVVKELFDMPRRPAVSGTWS